MASSASGQASISTGTETETEIETETEPEIGTETESETETEGESSGSDDTTYKGVGPSSFRVKTEVKKRTGSTSNSSSDYAAVSSRAAADLEADLFSNTIQEGSSGSASEHSSRRDSESSRLGREEEVVEEELVEEE